MRKARRTSVTKYHQAGTISFFLSILLIIKNINNNEKNKKKVVYINTIILK